MNLGSDVKAVVVWSGEAPRPLKGEMGEGAWGQAPVPVTTSGQGKDT